MKKKPFNVLKKAADKGGTNALYNLGIFYENGIGTSKDEKKSLSMF